MPKFEQKPDLSKQKVPGSSAEGEHLEVSVTLQPAEFFEGNDGEMRQLATTNNFEVVFRVKDGKERYLIYNEVGKLIDFEKFIPSIGFSGVEVEKKMETAKETYVNFDNNQGHYTIPKILRDFGLDPSLETVVRKQFKKVFNNDNYPDTFKIRGKTQALIPTQVQEIRSSSDKKKIIFKSGNILVIYTTIGPKGEVLAPDDWTEEIHKDISKIKQSELASNPYLREFVITQKGSLLENSVLAINNENNILNLIDTDKNIRIYTDASVGYAIDPIDKKTIYYVNAAQNELRIFEADKATAAQTNIESRKLPFHGTVKDFKFDPQGNFFLFLVEEGGTTSLYITEKDTLNISANITGISGNLDVDNLGNIYFIDNNNQLRFATTNFMTFPKGGLEQARKDKKEKLLKLREKLTNFDFANLPKGGGPKNISPEATEEDILRTLGKQLEGQLAPEIEKAKTADELEEVGFKIDALKTDPELSGHPEIFRPLEDKISKKISSIKTEGLRASLDDFEKLLGSSNSIQEALDLDNRYNDLLQQRREVVIGDAATRKDIDEKLTRFEKEKDAQFAKFEGAMTQNVTERFGEVIELIKEVGTPEELNSLASEKPVVDFEKTLAQMKDRRVAQDWRKKYKEALKAKKDELDKQISSKKEEERTRLAQLLEENREILEEIEATLGTEVSDPKELTKWLRTNPLVTKFHTHILVLPEEMRRTEEERLNDLIKERKRDLEHRKVLNIPKKGGEVNFGKESFPVFEDVKVVWQPKVIPLAEGSEYGNLLFQDNLGRVYKPDFGSVPIKLDDPLTLQTIELFRANAERYFESLKRRVPAYNEKWVMNDYNKAILGDIAKLSKIQVNEHRGILILEGEAGTGKNVMVDMFAHFVNRETFTFSCNFQSEKEDITYAFKFDPQKGTYQVDSRLLEMLQTPGAVIILDEINTLPPGVGKMLNPLLDYRRTLFLPDGREIKAEPSVLIVGTMNPQHYLGVKPLSQEVKSRSRILQVDYPPEKVGNKSAPYEGQILAKYLNAFSGMNDEEIALAWDYVANNNTANGADKFLTDERKEGIKKLQLIIKTANKIREAYKAFRMGTSADMIEFVFSLRETVDIASELNHVKDVKEAIKDVVLPKISDPAEKLRIRTIIENV